jgi:hypothetical protein
MPLSRRSRFNITGTASDGTFRLKRSPVKTVFLGLGSHRNIGIVPMGIITWSSAQPKPFTMNGIDAFFLGKFLIFQLEIFPTLNSSSNMKGISNA